MIKKTKPLAKVANLRLNGSKWTSDKHQVVHYKGSHWPLGRKDCKKYILWRGCKISVIESTTILHRHNNAIISATSLIEIIDLKVERVLSEPITIGKIVHDVQNEKGVLTGSIQVNRICRVLTVIICIIKVETIRRLHGKLSIPKCSNIISTSDMMRTYHKDKKLQRFTM